MAKEKNFDSDLQLILFINLTVIILILSIFNLTIKPKTKTVILGVSDDKTYWEELVNKHPTYRDGWVELGRTDKVEEIDPNYN